MGSVRMCGSRAGLDLVFRVVMFVIDGSCPSSWLCVAPDRRTAQGGGGGAVQAGAGGVGRLARGLAERASVVVPVGG